MTLSIPPNKIKEKSLFRTPKKTKAEVNSFYPFKQFNQHRNSIENKSFQ
jgi:hypothetical protein